MTKFMPFPAATHRFADLLPNHPLMIKFQDLAKIAPLRNMVNQAKTNLKLKLVLLAILDKDEPYGLLNRPAYQSRLAEELELISHHPQKYLLDLILFFEDISYWFAGKNKVANIGRGPISSSLVNFLLQITHVDPLVFGLQFAMWVRTNNEPTIELECDNTEELIKYLKEKYGQYLKQLKIKTKYTLHQAVDKSLGHLPYHRRQLFTQYVAEARNAIRTLKLHHLDREEELFNFILQETTPFGDYFALHPDKKDQVLKLLKEYQQETNHAVGYVLTDEDYVWMEDVKKDNIVQFNLFSSVDYKALNVHLKASVFNDLIRKNLDARQQLTVLHEAIVYAQDRPGVIMMKESLNYLGQRREVCEVLSETRGQLLFLEQICLILQKTLLISEEVAVDLQRRFGKCEITGQEAAILAAKIGEEGQDIVAFLSWAGKYTFSKSHAIGFGLKKMLMP